jgi:hypothetical protein
MPGPDAIGSTKNGDTVNNDMEVKLQAKNLEGEPLQPEEQTTRTGAHEYGHTLGLKHGGESGSVLDSQTDANLMNQTEYTTSTSINNAQLEKAKKNAENDQRVKNHLEEKKVKNQY